MLKHIYAATIAVVSLFLVNTVHAQIRDHSGHGQNFTPVPRMYVQMSAEHAAACVQMEKEAQEPGSIPFGFWGYGHAKAHCMGWVSQLLSLSNSYCCGGEESGECRLTAINMSTKQAYIDGMWCDFGTDPVVIDGMDGAYALVCAGKTTESMRRNKQCPNVYCKGIAGGS